MFVKFFIFASIIGTATVGHNEGGFNAIQEKGLKPALVQAVKEADASSLTGNYGNT